MQTSSNAPLCEIENLQIGFPAHDGTLTDAVRGISLTVQRGERLGIVGESGSGKSLTGRALLGLLPPSAQWSADALRFVVSRNDDGQPDRRGGHCPGSAGGGVRRGLEARTSAAHA